MTGFDGSLFKSLTLPGRVAKGGFPPPAPTEPDLWVTHPALQVDRSSFETQTIDSRRCLGGWILGFLAVRYQQQPRFDLGYVRDLHVVAPLRAVGKREQQLA